MSNDRASWACEAYGPELDKIRPEHAPHCYFDLIDPCQVKVQCRVRMQIERARVWARLWDLAAQGEGYAWSILEDVESADDLLNAYADPRPAEPAPGESPSVGSNPPD